MTIRDPRRWIGASGDQDPRIRRPGLDENLDEVLSGKLSRRCWSRIPSSQGLERSPPATSSSSSASSDTGVFFFLAGDLGNVARGLLYFALLAHFLLLCWTTDAILVIELSPDWPWYEGALKWPAFLVHMMIATVVSIITSLACLAILAALLLGILWSLWKMAPALRDLQKYSIFMPLLSVLAFGTLIVGTWVLYDVVLLGRFDVLWGRELGYEYDGLAKFVRGAGNVILYVAVLGGLNYLWVRLSSGRPLLFYFDERLYWCLFACSNLLFAFLYYRLRYSSAGTVKPAWTDNLG